jgi:hypothetical protein
MKYVVKPGDTLSKIAKDAYGDANRWREIFEANKDKIENPSVIRPGWELLIPGVGAEEAAQVEPAKGEIVKDEDEREAPRRGVDRGREQRD